MPFGYRVVLNRGLLWGGGVFGVSKITALFLHWLKLHLNQTKAVIGAYI